MMCDTRGRVNEIKMLQQKTLEILLYFKDFCDKHGLTFFLCGGCAIGAVRHGGFIPWDDDIDCFMPRQDYEKLKSVWNKYGDKEKYTYCRTDRKNNYHYAGILIADNNTTFINRHNVDEDICHGIELEVIPLDGYPKKPLSRAWQIMNALIFNLFNFQRLPDNKGKLIRTAAKILFFLIPSKKLRDDIWIFAEKQMSKYQWQDCDYVTELIGSTFKSMFFKHPKEYFDKVIYKKFEGYDVPLMAGYEYYLRKGFGDYMRLPPEEKRKPKHDTVYISTTEPYTKFKGVYYCCKK